MSTKKPGAMSSTIGGKSSVSATLGGIGSLAKAPRTEAAETLRLQRETYHAVQQVVRNLATSPPKNRDESIEAQLAGNPAVKSAKAAKILEVSQSRIRALKYRGLLTGRRGWVDSESIRSYVKNE